MNLHYNIYTIKLFKEFELFNIEVLSHVSFLLFNFIKPLYHAKNLYYYLI